MGDNLNKGNKLEMFRKFYPEIISYTKQERKFMYDLEKQYDAGAHGMGKRSRLGNLYRIFLKNIDVSIENNEKYIKQSYADAKVRIEKEKLEKAYKGLRAYAISITFIMVAILFSLSM